MPIKFFHVHVIWPCIFTSRNLCYRNAHTNIQSSIDCNIKNYKQFKCMSVGIWLNKLWSVHNMQYCAAIIKDEVDHCVLTWIGFHYISEWKKHVNLCELWVYVYKRYIHGSKSGRIHTKNPNWLLLGSAMGKWYRNVQRKKLKILKNHVLLL